MLLDSISFFELLVEEIEVQNKFIRIITGCGPQENWQEDKRRCERSCIDLVILSSELREEFKSLEIDESRKHFLTRISYTIMFNVFVSL